MGQKLTKGDVEKIQAEIDQRRIELRPQLTSAVAEAAAQGDRSENFEYYAAKKENNRNNSRIRYLQNVLRYAEMVEDAPEGEVGVDKEVTVYIPEDDEEETFILVTPIRTNSLNNIVSIDSPIGRALMHHRVGDTVVIRVSDSYSYECEIRSVKASALAASLDISEF